MYAKQILCLFSLLVSLTVVKPDQFSEDVLELHNKYRGYHHVPPVILSSTLDKAALNWAKVVATKQRPAQPGESPYGFNIAIQNVGDSAQNMIEYWYREKRLHEFETASEMRHATRHFTQMVWKESEEIGVGVVKSGPKQYVVVAYSPKGNRRGKFKKNVFPKVLKSRTNEDEVSTSLETTSIEPKFLEAMSVEQIYEPYTVYENGSVAIKAD